MHACVSPCMHMIVLQVVDGTVHGWEECVEAGTTHLLRTCLARNAKEQAVQVRVNMGCMQQVHVHEGQHGMRATGA